MRHPLLASCLALSIAAAMPLAQAQQDTQGQSTAQRADRDDHGEWGWLGLLGLAGLIGLKRRERHDDIRHGHAPAR